MSENSPSKVAAADQPFIHFISTEAVVSAETLSDPTTKMRQLAGPIHVHPNGRFVYLTNRAYAFTDFAGKKLFAGGENAVAVFAIYESTADPTLFPSADGHANYFRTFGILATRKTLVA